MIPRSPEFQKSPMILSRRRMLQVAGSTLAGGLLAPQLAQAEELFPPNTSPDDIFDLSSRGIFVWKEGKAVDAPPYIASDSLGLHHEIVAKAKENSVVKHLALGVTGESYYAPEGFLADGKTNYGVHKIDRTLIEPGTFATTNRIITEMPFAGSEEKVGWQLDLSEAGLKMNHVYDPKGTRWLPRDEKIGVLRGIDPNKRLIITRLFAIGGEVQLMQITNGDVPKNYVPLSPQDRTEVA
jgi:hypothetical protein